MLLPVQLQWVSWWKGETEKTEDDDDARKIEKEIEKRNDEWTLERQS